MKETASEYHRQRRGNCAQSVAFAWGAKNPGGRGVEESFAGYGGGRAPSGLCGAVFAGCELAGAAAAEAIKREFAEGLKDIELYSHIYLVYHLHRVDAVRLRTKPFLQDVEHGIFATRAPWRPNPIGLSIVKLVGREGNVLLIEGADILDGTPLLDIKPYSKRFDNIPTQRNGWQDDVDDATAWARGRRGYKGKQ